MKGGGGRMEGGVSLVKKDKSCLVQKLILKKYSKKIFFV